MDRVKKPYIRLAKYLLQSWAKVFFSLKNPTTKQPVKQKLLEVSTLNKIYQAIFKNSKVFHIPINYQKFNSQISQMEGNIQKNVPECM